MVFPWVPMKSCVFFRLYTHFLTHKPLRSQDCSPLIRYDCEVTDTSQVLSEADLMGSSWGGGVVAVLKDGLPSRELSYLSFGRGKSSTQIAGFQGICYFHGG